MIDKDHWLAVRTSLRSISRESWDIVGEIGYVMRATTSMHLRQDKLRPTATQGRAAPGSDRKRQRDGPNGTPGSKAKYITRQLERPTLWWYKTNQASSDKHR